jgi:hypothetical protein
VRPRVWADLVAANEPLIVAGYASIAQLIDLVADWSDEHRSDGSVRVLLGAEPYPTARRNFSSSSARFTAEVRRFWLEERGVSLRLSARIVQALTAIDTARLSARFMHGSTGLHAKIYLGAEAATVGSSNFTSAGLSEQIEVNARFTASGEPDRHRELVAIGENLWAVGADWTAELRSLLEAMLQVVGWQEALARACAEVLEGDWAARYLAGADTGRLWPSQRAGIAQALWVTKDVGSVLVADATGSGKTKMGAHLVRAVRDRLWSTGRVHRDLAVLVCPPAVADTWKREAVGCGLNLVVASHGLLSRAAQVGARSEQEAVARAQVLAVDEAHNFLNRDANRTRQLRSSQADHVVLFTATPINRGAGDLLSLVNLLGADNFTEETLSVLNRLDRRRGGEQGMLNPAELHRLRTEIGRFMVRRTKTALNLLVDRDPPAYAHPDTGRVCRYPDHDARTYPTGETTDDEAVADTIRALTARLTGVAQLEQLIAVPSALRADFSDERWLEFRLTSTRGLAIHHVLGALRSSRAAVVEHLTGTASAVAHFGLDPGFKSGLTGDVVGKLTQRAGQGPPEVQLSCPLPGWLTDRALWAERCDGEADLYRQMSDAVTRLSAAREQAKVDLLARLSRSHDRLLAFDPHLISLAALARQLRHRHRVDAVVATGADQAARRRVESLFARTSTRRAVALCSDALNEGLNLQGASAIVHLDLPTTLRVAEQRVGRVDRMDSPHERIEAWWPDDGPAFATRANELLTSRSEESARLLGANLTVPPLTANLTEDATPEAPAAIVDVNERIAAAETASAEVWDGLRDALEPVRGLVSDPDALIPAVVYDELRRSGHRVVARVATVHTRTPWAFLSVAGSSDGAPRWHYLHGPDLRPVRDLDDISAHLRRQLSPDPPSCPLDQAGLDLLDQALQAAADSEFALLPRRMQRALTQMTEVLRAWTVERRRSGDELSAQALTDLARLARPAGADTAVDPYLVAERWITLVSPALEDYRRTHRHRPYILISDLTPSLVANPLPQASVHEAFDDLPLLTPLAERVTACILGVPDDRRSADEPGRRPGHHFGSR